ncbi:MAG: hypothetical protein ACRCY4_06460 [Brevinema sp.]
MKVLIIILLLLTTCAKQPAVEAQSTIEAVNLEEVVRKQLPQDETVDIEAAIKKYQAREDLTETEYDALRQPLSDWDIFNRLVRVEDGFDNLLQFHLNTNTVAPNLNWLDIVYYDPIAESYYYGEFKSVTVDGLADLINTKKNPAHEVYGRDRVVLITNLSPSTHIYADAYNNYQLYALELKSTIDEYVAMSSLDDFGDGEVFIGTIDEYVAIRSLDDNNKNIYSCIYIGDYKIKAMTNRTFYKPILYYQVDKNNQPVSPIFITPYVDKESVDMELATTNKKPESGIVYSEENKSLYYGRKYNFYGDIAELTNENPPMGTNLGYLQEGGSIEDDEHIMSMPRDKFGALIQYML